MSGMTYFDLRLALGWLFVIIGALLVVAGLRGLPGGNVISLGININLIWGVVLIGFGVVNLWFAFRYARRRRVDERVRLGLQKDKSGS
jgi:hypothetical protein